MPGSASDTASFSLALQNKMSSPALDAARSLDTLKAKIDADTKALRGLQQAQQRLKGGTVQDIATHKKLKDEVTATRARTAASTQSFLDLGGSAASLATPTKEAENAFSKLGDTAKGMGGPIGDLGTKYEKISKLVTGGGAMVVGSLAFAAALLAVAAAAVTAAVALGSYALSQSEARRNELLHLEGLTTMRRYYGLARGSGQELQEQIDRFSDSTTLSRGAVAGYAEQLYRMGLRGRNASAALDAVTLAAQVQGQAGAARTASWAAGLARTGGDVTRLAALMRSRLGGIAERQVLSLDNQTAKLHDRLARIFSGVRIEGFLRALNSITSLFSQSSAEGAALKTIVEALFNPLFDSVGAGAPVVKRFFQGMILETQGFVISILRVRAWVHRTFGKEWLDSVGGATTALEGGKIAIAAVVGVLSAAAIVAGLLVVALAAIAAGVALVAGPFVAVSAAIVYGLTKAYEFVASFQGRFRTAGDDMVRGLVAGILNGTDAVTRAVRSVAESARTTLVDALGIHSPSRVFAELGAQVPRGFAQGVSETSGMAGGAVGAMGGGAESAGAALRGGDRSITIQQLVIHAGPSGDPQTIVAAVREAFASLLEGTAIEMGAET